MEKKEFLGPYVVLKKKGGGRQCAELGHTAGDFAPRQSENSGLELEGLQWCSLVWPVGAVCEAWGTAAGPATVKQRTAMPGTGWGLTQAIHGTAHCSLYTITPTPEHTFSRRAGGTCLQSII